MIAITPLLGCGDQMEICVEIPAAFSSLFVHCLHAPGPTTLNVGCIRDDLLGFFFGRYSSSCFFFRLVFIACNFNNYGRFFDIECIFVVIFFFFLFKNYTIAMLSNFIRITVKHTTELVLLFENASVGSTRQWMYDITIDVTILFKFHFINLQRETCHHPSLWSQWVYCLWRIHLSTSEWFDNFYNCYPFNRCYDCNEYPWLKCDQLSGNAYTF